MGWITSTRTLTTSPGLMLDGMRMRTRPMSAMDLSPGLAAATADGHLDLALGHEERAVGQLGDGAHVPRLVQPDVRPHHGLGDARGEVELGVHRATVLVGDDVDGLDMPLRGRR